MRSTQALRSNDAQTLGAICCTTVAYQNLTGQELRLRAAVQSTQRSAENQRAARAKHCIQQLKAQVQGLQSK